jgi:hypothetical protein
MRLPLPRCRSALVTAQPAALPTCGAARPYAVLSTAAILHPPPLLADQAALSCGARVDAADARDVARASGAGAASRYACAGGRNRRRNRAASSSSSSGTPKAAPLATKRTQHPTAPRPTSAARRRR